MTIIKKKHKKKPRKLLHYSFECITYDWNGNAFQKAALWNILKNSSSQSRIPYRTETQVIQSQIELTLQVICHVMLENDRRKEKRKKVQLKVVHAFSIINNCTD